MAEDRFAAVAPVWGTHPPGSPEWEALQHELSQRLDREDVFHWAAARLDDTSASLRRFVTELLHRMSFDNHALGARAVEVLRPRLRTEVDPVALEDLIGAFAEYSDEPGADRPAELSEILPLARHADPRIRRRVAAELIRATGEALQGRNYPGTFTPSATPRDVVSVLVELADDTDGPTRTAALRTLADSGIDNPQIRGAMAAHLNDDHPDARLEAAAGLALRDDPGGRDAILQISADTENESPTWWRIDSVKRILTWRAARNQST
jgi:hypothetical protein